LDPKSCVEREAGELLAGADVDEEGDSDEDALIRGGRSIEEGGVVGGGVPEAV